MKSIVFNPEWTVPSTIIREDLLPRLRGGGGMFGGGSSVLKQHELNVNYNGKRVSPSSINWNTVNMGAISFTQAPGPKNVLGKVKFLYPNRHSVYMHDTIKRELLQLQVRAEGHHCPRVANPGKVAAIILAEDSGVPQAEIDKLLAKGYNSGVAIKNRVPVHTTYFTLSADAEGKLQSFNDLYALDAGVAAAVPANRRSRKPSPTTPRSRPRSRPRQSPSKSNRNRAPSARPRRLLPRGLAAPFPSGSAEPKTSSNFSSWADAPAFARLSSGLFLVRGAFARAVAIHGRNHRRGER